MNPFIYSSQGKQRERIVVMEPRSLSALTKDLALLHRTSRYTLVLAPRPSMFMKGLQLGRCLLFDHVQPSSWWIPATIVT